MRKRSDASNEKAKPTGTITVEELEEVRKAYADGYRGDILIGLCGEKRITTMLLPVRPNSDESPAISQKILQKLKTIGCDRCQKITLSE